ncbi:MAG: hypothetical protein BIFFINMI_02393 [Phycisphaerae bacterium]|nr:hypothetical protein [Phycisphaerae bacterium]
MEKRYFASIEDYDQGTGTPAEYVTYGYDGLGRNTSVVQHFADETTATTAYTYNDLWELVRVDRPEGAINYEYDSVYRLVRTYTGDADTDHESVADDGKAVTDTRYAYDDLGRLSQVAVYERNDTPLTTPEVVEYRYDLEGKLEFVHTPNGVLTTYGYDDMDRLVSVKNAHDGGTQWDDSDDTAFATFEYTLASNGNRIVAEETIDGQVTNIAWTYDDDGRLIREAYDGYDAAGQALNYTDTYAFDLNGNRLSKTHDLGSDQDIEESTTYTYDANDRLLTETLDSSTEGADRFTVYAYGNSDAGTEQTGKTVYQGLDDAGDVLEETTYAYDLADRLAEVVVDATGGGGGITTTNFAYNDDGLRVAQTVDDGQDVKATIYLVDDNNLTGYSQVLEEKQAGDSGLVVTRSYTIGAAILGQQSPDAAGGSPLWFVTDGHGSTRLVLDSAGEQPVGGEGQPAVASRFAYDAYGNALGFDASQAVTAVLYSGQLFDNSTGLHYLRGRYYDSSPGGFTQLDPFSGFLSSPATLGGYGYVGSNPINGADPSGMFWILLKAASTAWSIYDTYSDATAAIEQWGLADAAFLTAQAAVESGGGASVILASWTAGLFCGVQAAFFTMSAISGAKGLYKAPEGAVAKGAQTATKEAVEKGVKEAGEKASAKLEKQVVKAGDEIPVPTPSRATAPSKGAQNLTGQQHHAVTTKVQRATEAHPNLRGQYQARDPRFVTQAKDLPSHRGYQRWHRELDAEVTNWVRRNHQATPADFEAYLRHRYSQPDLINRFPNGLGGAE